MLWKMDPPSTPAPLGLRGRTLDRELCAIDPSRRRVESASERDQGPPTARDPRAELAAIEAHLRESPPSDPGPMSLRGDELAVVLEHAVSSRVRVKH